MIRQGAAGLAERLLTQRTFLINKTINLEPRFKQATKQLCANEMKGLK